MQNTCHQCGTCCRKGGPLLHKADLTLIPSIGLTRILTLRKGELVHDPVQNCLLPLQEEAIKITGTGEKAYPWHCILHKKFTSMQHDNAPESKTFEGCGLHPLRPAQCHALFCEDTRAVTVLYTQERLTRADILKPEIFHAQGFHVKAQGDDLLALAQAHEEQCSLVSLVELARTLHNTASAASSPQSATALTGPAADEILECIHYDTAFRQLCTEKGGIAAPLLPLLLGRPLPIFLQSLGLSIQKNIKNGHLALYNMGNSPYFSNTTVS